MFSKENFFLINLTTEQFSTSPQSREDGSISGAFVNILDIYNHLCNILDMYN